MDYESMNEGYIRVRKGCSDSGGYEGCQDVPDSTDHEVNCFCQNEEVGFVHSVDYRLLYGNGYYGKTIIMYRCATVRRWYRFRGYWE